MSASMAGGKAKIVVERRYKATLKEVWDLWTTKEGFESWWGPQGFHATVHEIDARPGGVLRYDMIPDTPDMAAAMERLGGGSFHAVTSRFSELKPHSRLQLTAVIDFFPGVDAYESVVEVDFVADGDHVRMIVTLGGMHSDEFTGMQKQGFQSQLTKLDGRFG